MGFRVRDGAEAMIHAVRKALKSESRRVLMQGDIANAYGSINRLAVLKVVRKHASCLGPLGMVRLHRKEARTEAELHHSVAKGVWQGSTLSSAAFCLTFWEIDQSKSCLHKQRIIKLATQNTHIQKRDCGTGNRNNGMELDDGGRNVSDTGTEETG